MSDHQDLAPYAGKIGACLEAALDLLESISTQGQPSHVSKDFARALWLIQAAELVNDQLAHATNLR